MLILPPGLAIALTVLAANLMGDGIRDSLGVGERRGAATSKPPHAPRQPRPAPPSTPYPAEAGAGGPAVLEISGLSVGHDSYAEMRMILEDVRSSRIMPGRYNSDSALAGSIGTVGDSVMVAARTSARRTMVSHHMCH